MKHWMHIIIFSLLLLPLEAFSEIIEKTDSCWASAGCYEVKGNITKNDKYTIDTIETHIISHGKIGPNFSLNSSGGDVESAIYIGRKLRALRASAIVLVNSICYSSCAYVLAGATQRIVAGKVGIHKPYLEKTGDLKYDELQKTYNRLNSLSKSYLSDMNLPPSLFDEMLRTPSQNLKVLTENELSRFGLNSTDPVQQEQFDSKEAAEYNLSKSEYLLRKSQVENQCKQYFSSGDFQEYANCQNIIYTNKSSK